MLLDVTTLTLAGGIVSFSCGIFLLSYWWHDRTSRPAFWWAAGNCGLGIGIILLALHSILPFYVANVVAPLLLDLCAVLAFGAARIFNRGSINHYRVMVYTAGWIIIVALTGAYTHEQFAAALGTATSGSLYAAVAYEFWLGRGEELPGRRPMIVVVLFYAAALFLVSMQFASVSDYIPVPSVNWLGAIQFVGLFYSLGVTLCLVVMLKTRNEIRYKTAALTDPLTGLANRRAFTERAQRVFDRAGVDASPVALLAFDLDRFKLINDTFGHAIGDQVLRLFAEVLSSALRPTNIVARIGGEEFVAVIPGVDDDAGLAIANRIRNAFKRTAQFLDGQKIEATVSVGVATTVGRTFHLTELLGNADAALYHAKTAAATESSSLVKNPKICQPATSSGSPDSRSYRPLEEGDTP